MKKHLKQLSEKYFEHILISIPKEQKEYEKATIFKKIVLRMFHKDMNIHNESAYQKTIKATKGEDSLLTKV